MGTPTGGSIHALPSPGVTAMSPVRHPASLCASPPQQLYTLSCHQNGVSLLAEQTYLIPKNVPFQAGAQQVRSRQPKIKALLTASKNSSKTSVASLECKPCKSKTHSVRSSGVSLPSPVVEPAIPRQMPRPPPTIL